MSSPNSHQHHLLPLGACKYPRVRGNRDANCGRMMTHIYIHLNVIVKNVRNDLLRIFKVNEEDDEYVPYSPPSSSSEGSSGGAAPEDDDGNAQCGTKMIIRKMVRPPHLLLFSHLLPQPAAVVLPSKCSSSSSAQSFTHSLWRRFSIPSSTNSPVFLRPWDVCGRLAGSS